MHVYMEEVVMHVCMEMVMHACIKEVVMDGCVCGGDGDGFVHGADGDGSIKSCIYLNIHNNTVVVYIHMINGLLYTIHCLTNIMWVQ